MEYQNLVVLVKVGCYKYAATSIKTHKLTHTLTPNVEDIYIVQVLHKNVTHTVLEPNMKSILRLVRTPAMISLKWLSHVRMHMSGMQGT